MLGAKTLTASLLFAAALASHSVAVAGAATCNDGPGDETHPPVNKKCTIKLNPQDEHNIQLDCPHSDRVRFIGLGDWGAETETPYVLGVRDGVVKQAATGTHDFLLSVGDNFYNYDKAVASVSDPIWQSVWHDRWQIGSNLTLPWISYMGNHDYDGNAQAQIDFGKSGQPGAEYWIMPSKYYSIDATMPTGKKFKMTIVDTETIKSDDEFAWAAKEFQDPTAEFVLAAGHHHLYSQGKDGDNTKKRMVKLRELIESSDNVKAYLCGHDHSMQYLRNANKDYFMFGGGGREIKSSDVGPGTSAEVKYFQLKYGFAEFDIQLSSRTMTVTYHIFNDLGHEIDTPVFTRVY